MPVAIYSRAFDAYAEEEQKGQLSTLAKWQWLELDATLKHVFLAHQHLGQYFKRVTHLTVIAILPCGPLCKRICIYTNTKVI